MRSLRGVISDRLRAMLKSGELPTTAINPPRAGTEPPSPRAVRNGEGHGLGRGATRRRSGPGARTTE